MPLKVRIKLFLIILVAALCDFLFWRWSTAMGLSFLVVGILYAEMIYPKWNFFGRAVLNVKDRGKNAVAITFDDGPSAWTTSILDALKAENVKATFFLLGVNVSRFPEIAKRIESDGHALGLHGQTHTKFHFNGPRFIRNDLDECEKAFESAGLLKPKLIRFPHGFKNIFAVTEARRRGLTLCGWGKGVWDSKRPGVKIIVERSQTLKSGEILLLHDGDGAKENPDRAQTAEALPKIIRALKTKGYRFVTLQPQNVS